MTGGDTIGEIIIMKLNEEVKKDFLKISFHFCSSIQS